MTFGEKGRLNKSLWILITSNATILLINNFWFSQKSALSLDKIPYENRGHLVLNIFAEYVPRLMVFRLKFLHELDFIGQQTIKCMGGAPYVSRNGGWACVHYPASRIMGISALVQTWGETGTCLIHHEPPIMPNNCVDWELGATLANRSEAAPLRPH